jgi:S1-C subfamily serine protease
VTRAACAALLAACAAACALLAACAAACALLAACGGAGAERAGQGGALSPAEITRRATPAVVQIRAPGRIGSGFVVGAGGLVATCLHVVADAEQVTVVLADGRSFDEVEVVAYDEAQDLVVLAIEARHLPVLPLARAPIAAGERVVTIGHPHGLSNTVSDGLVSAVRHDALDGEGLQISAPISPGSSGGPVLNDRGQVVGVTTSTHRVGQNLNFATPVAHLGRLLRSRERRPLSALPSRFAGRLFARCGAAELVAVYRGLGRARARAVRRSSARLEDAVMDLVLGLDGCPGVSRMLLFALEEASAHDDPRERAAVLEVVLGQIEKALRQMMRSP